MSPRRLGEKSRLWCYRYLVIRDGEHCQVCGESPATRNNSNEPLKLEIDHVDGDPWNWNPDNLRLLCKNDNIAARNRASCAPQGDSAHKERERMEGNPATRIIRSVVDYSHPDAPVTMQANFLYEVDFRAYALKRVREEGHASREDVVYAGAEKVGCSPQVTRLYLRKLTSSAGPLKEHKDMLGGWMIEFKDWQSPDGFNQSGKSPGSVSSASGRGSASSNGIGSSSESSSMSIVSRRSPSNFIRKDIRASSSSIVPRRVRPVCRIFSASTSGIFVLSSLP